MPKRRNRLDFNEVRKIALELPGVEESTTSRGRSLKICGRLLTCPAMHRSVEPNSLMVRISIVVGIVGIISPDSVTTVRRQYFATPIGLYTAGAVRVAMGLVLILVAPTSRAPKTLRALGALVCMQGFAAQLFGLDRARAILEWEAMHTALLRTGAVVASATGGFVAFAVIAGRGPESRVG